MPPLLLVGRPALSCAGRLVLRNPERSEGPYQLKCSPDLRSTAGESHINFSKSYLFPPERLRSVTTLVFGLLELIIPPVTLPLALSFRGEAEESAFSSSRWTDNR